MGRTGSIALALRVRDEWSLTEGLLASLAGVCDEAWILDDRSVTPAPIDRLALLLPRVTVLRASRWSGEGRGFGEGTQRDHLIQRIKRESRCGWILQLDADERLGDPSALVALAASPDADAWVLPLVDFYITEDDHDLVDAVDPAGPRTWFGVETRWTLCLFRPARTVYVSRGDVREPQGFAARRVQRSPAPIVEHYGKAVSVAEWERKADAYVARYPQYREKWLARKGGAIHHGTSDFGTPLVRRADPAYDPATAPAIYSFTAETGAKAWIKGAVYGAAAPSLRTVSTTPAPAP